MRETALNDKYPVGTCPILPRNKGSMVGPYLKVYGVDKLKRAYNL